MILLDTHIWIWWVHGSDLLTPNQKSKIETPDEEIGICAISLWEVAKLVEYDRLQLPMEIGEWFEAALHYPGISVIPLTVDIVIESTRLPGNFHKDPADQLIVATARVLDCPLVTSDTKINRYPNVQTIY